MGFKVNKRIKIAPGVNLNVSKKGLSTSVKVGKTTFNSRGKVTTNLGHGVSYTTNLKNNKKYTNTNLELTQSFNEEVARLKRNKNNWANLSDNQVKYYNIFMKILLILLTLVLSLLSIFSLSAIPFAIISGIYIFKFDANKLRIKHQILMEKHIENLKQVYDIK